MCKSIETYGEKMEMMGKIDIACRMLKANFDVNQIADMTGLPVSKVIELKNETPVQEIR